MAQLRSTTAPSMTVNSNIVWTAANDGSTNGAQTGLDANAIAGWTKFDFDIPARINTSTTLSGGLSNTFYPMVFTEDDWSTGGDGCPLIMTIVRNDPNQNGVNQGRFFMKIKYRATNWGFHQNHWEVLENFGDGSGYPFVANIAQPGTANYLSVWMRGGLTYSFSFGTRATLFDSNVKAGAKGGWTGNVGSTTGDGWSWENPQLSTGGVAPQTALSIPSSAHYYQQHFCSKGFDLGTTAYRATNCFVVTQNLSSDVRYKSDFKVSLGSQFLEKLNPIAYEWKEDTTNITHYGLSAQQVKSVMDELHINTADFAGYDERDPDNLAIDYNQFIPIIINAIKENDIILKNLKNRILKLEENYGSV